MERSLEYVFSLLLFDMQLQLPICFLSRFSWAGGLLQNEQKHIVSRDVNNMCSSTCALDMYCVYKYIRQYAFSLFIINEMFVLSPTFIMEWNNFFNAVQAFFFRRAHTFNSLHNWIMMMVVGYSSSFQLFKFLLNALQYPRSANLMNILHQCLTNTMLKYIVYCLIQPFHFWFEYFTCSTQ